MTGDQTLHAARKSGSVRDIDLEIAPPVIDEVVADMGGSIAERSAGGRLAGALDRPQRDSHLSVSARRGEFLNRLALSIPAEEVHPSIRAGGIPLQHLFDQADRLDILAPINGGTEAQAADGIGHRDLVCGLPLMLAANRRFRGCFPRRQVFLDRRTDGRQAKTVLADPMQDLDDGGDLEG